MTDEELSVKDGQGGREDQYDQRSGGLEDGGICDAGVGGAAGLFAVGYNQNAVSSSLAMSYIRGVYHYTIHMILILYRSHPTTLISNSPSSRQLSSPPLGTAVSSWSCGKSIPSIQDRTSSGSLCTNPGSAPDSADRRLIVVLIV